MFFKKNLINFDLKKLKKPPQNVAYLSRNSVVSEIFHLLPNECPTAQMAEFLFQNVVYRATVYRTGVSWLEYFLVFLFLFCILEEIYIKSSYHHDIELLFSDKQKLDTPGGKN